jgi:hypothetical protein
MPLYAFVAPIQPHKTEEFRQFVTDLSGSRKNEYEASRRELGVSRETIFLQKTPMGQVAIVVQEAQNQEEALASLRNMKDTFNKWYFQRIKDVWDVNFVGPDVPLNELLLDYRV